MFCVHCGVVLAPNSKYCQACGKLAAPEADPVPQATSSKHVPKIIPPRPSFSGLRKVNWAVAALLTIGLALMLFRAPSVAGVAIILLVGAVIVAFPVISATALGSEDLFLLGMYIHIDTARRLRLRRVALVFNWIICCFGVLGMVACIVTGQIGPMVSMLFYVLVPALNIKALRELARFERDYAGYEPVPENA
jgi:hypothetical protein